MSEVTRILDSLGTGESESAAELLPLVYGELRQLAAAKMAGEFRDNLIGTQYRPWHDFDMRRKGVDVDRLVGDRAIAGDWRAVGCKERDLRRGDRLKRLGKRRGHRQPRNDQEEHQ